jgi:hypothetical protein
MKKLMLGAAALFAVGCSTAQPTRIAEEEQRPNFVAPAVA